MLDHRQFIDQPDEVLAALTRRGVPSETVHRLSHLAGLRRSCIQEVEALRHRLNEASASLKDKARAGDKAAIEAARGELKGLKDTIKRSEEQARRAQDDLETLLLSVPNVPDVSVPSGADESENREERRVGTPRKFDFEPQPHWELGQKLGILDFEQASRMSGARFAVYRGAGARLERALAAMMLELAAQSGYTEIVPPLLVRPHAMVGAGQYPKFVGESFETLDSEYALIPTSEVPLVNLHREEIVEQEALPLRYTAYTPCFRREAGAAGRDTRGLIRNHQFSKVELVSFVAPQDSTAELERMTGCAEAVLQALELPYRVVSLCTGDLSFGSVKTYDLEVWLPAQGAYREISSCSNCTDYQARRMQIRYRPSASDGGKAKPQLLHTLNGSGVAVGRALVAVLENGQQADGSIRLPKALATYFGADVVAP